MPLTTVSRWTMSYFGASLVAFVLAQTVMALGWSYPAQAVEAAGTLITVHLITIGWLSTLILGALCQFVPVITTKPLASNRAALASLIMIQVGLVLALSGFAALGGYGDAPSAFLPCGGFFVLSGFATGAANLGVVLWRARPLPLCARFIAFGLGFLLVTGGLGVTFGLVLDAASMPNWLLPLQRSGLALHVVAGVAGWFTLTAMGVSYRLLSMFMLAPETEDGISGLVLRGTAAGLALWWCASLAEAYDATSSHFISDAGCIVWLAGMLLYGFDMARLFRARKRRRLELNSIAAAAAISTLVIGLLALAVVAAQGRVGAFAGPLLYLFGFGWLSGLGLSQLYKIIPFLTWLERFGALLGKAPVPRVQDLVDERRAAPWFVLYFAAVLAGAACGFVGWTGLWRVATVVHLVATILIIGEFWRARRPRVAALLVGSKARVAASSSFAKGGA